MFELIDGTPQCPQCRRSFKSAHLGAILIDIPVEDKTDWIQNRVAALRSALDHNLLPEAEPGWLCSYCGHGSKCLFGQLYQGET